MGTIEIVKGDITCVRTDAIVNAANSSLLGGGGVDGAIHRAAGPALLEECRKIGGCPPGQARMTKGYNLPAPRIIHTVGPIYKGIDKDSKTLKDCYINCLVLALDNDIKTIAFPAISCGVYGYPVEKASRIALKTTVDFLNRNTSVTTVIFVLSSESFVQVYETNLSLIKQEAGYGRLTP
jgi:O-acetyl-ADP-ribose deacetylase (regulator of RNase III)